MSSVQTLFRLDPNFIENLSKNKDRVTWRIFPGVSTTREEFSEMFDTFRYSESVIFSVLATLSLLSSVRVPFSVPNSMSIIKDLSACNELFDVLRLPVFRSFVEEVVLQCAVFETGKTIPRLSLTVKERLLDIVRREPEQVRRLLSTRFNVVKGGYRVSQSYLWRILQLKDEYRYSLHITRSRHFTGDLVALFTSVSSEIRDCRNVKAFSMGESTEEAPHTEYKTLIQLFDRNPFHPDCVTRLVWSEVSKEVPDGDLTLKVDEDLKIPVEDSTYLFVPNVCCYNSREKPSRYSGSGLHKANTKTDLSVELRTRLSFDVVPKGKFVVR